MTRQSLEALGLPAVWETERLRLRPWREEGAAELFRWARDPEIGPATGWLPHRDEADSLDVLRNILMKENTWAVTLRGSDAPLGSLSVFSTDFSRGNGEPEIGYWLARPFWGRGLIPEAVRALTDYAFGTLGLRTLRCGYFEGNEKSRRVQEKCGFVYERTRKDILWPATGEIRTEHVTRLDRETWRDSR